MPEYEFRCEMCEGITSIVRSITDTLSRDPYCESCMIPMKRIWQPTPTVFKTGGFYSTDSKGK